MDIFALADRGGNSAWKGFSSQTIYIASRLITEKDKTKNYFPESIEDLKIVDSNNMTTELIQVKNLSRDLSLSDFEPKKEGSFLKRALSVRQENRDLVVRLISYGNIGPELLHWSIQKTGTLSKDNITTKLETYGYDQADIEWLRKNVLIEKQDEKNLERQIFSELENNIETAISPEIVFDVLISYVSRLSRHHMSTSTIVWQEKIRTVSLSLAAISGWKNQFGKTILPLSEYCDFDINEIESQRNDYKNGVNALPQHIMSNFDIVRPYWLDRLKETFTENTITILHGASGQGKSSLAYRYLIDNYATNEVFVVSGISNLQQAIDIASALRELQKKGYFMIVYIDVRPYDKNWVWLIEQVYTLNLSFPVLVTIREEDFNRNPIDINYIQYNDIELRLNEIEAREIYNRYPTDNHVSFEASWETFGESGLLLEYVFFLRENMSLRNRIKSQIEKLILEEENVDNWLLALLIISYAGRKEVPINCEKLLKSVEITNSLKMLQVFNKEYWVRSSDNGIMLSTLHAVRATILCEILFEKLISHESEILLKTISFTDYYPQTLIIDYFSRESVSSVFLDKLSDITFTTWATYAGVIESLLWLSVWQYYKTYENIIDEGNILSNNSFAFLMMTDITGYLKIDVQQLWNMFKETNPIRFQQTIDLLDRIEEKSIDYSCVDKLLKKKMSELPLEDSLNSDSLTYCGYILFWHAQRGFMIESALFDDAICHLDYSDILSICEFCLGVQMQKWCNVYNRILEKAKPILSDYLNIIYLNDEEDILYAYAINDISAEGSNHSKIMLAVDALRLLYCDKKEYHINLIGSNILEGIPVLDNIKTIANDKLPYKWITRMNGWFININEYKYQLNDWREVYQQMTNKRQNICELSGYFCKAIDEYFQKGKINRFINETSLAKGNLIKESNSNIKEPKCAVNKYGMRAGISNFSDISSVFTQVPRSSSSIETHSAIKAYNEYLQDFQNFLNQKDQLLIEKLKNLPVSNVGRLSCVNLMFALMHFPSMLSLFNTCFDKYINKESIDIHEEENLFLLGLMWTHVYTAPAWSECSTIYSLKKELNNQREQISTFIKESIIQISGVQEVIYTDKKEIFILLEILSHESFLKEIHQHVYDLFGSFEYATFNYALFSFLVNRIYVQFSYNSVPTIGGFVINSLDFTKPNEQDFLLTIKNNAAGFDKQYWPSPESKIKHILLISGYIESLILLQRHTDDVFQYLSQIEVDEYLIKSTINNWRLRCNSITKEIFESTRNSCRILQGFIDGYEQKTSIGKFLESVQTLSEIDDLIMNSAFSAEKVEKASILKEYKNSFEGIIGLILTD